MKSTLNPPAPQPTTNPLLDGQLATLVEERRQLAEEREAFRVQESNLREYEARLRRLQAEIEAARTAPMGPDGTSPAIRQGRSVQNDTALQVAWEKLHRARELLEAEQANLRDERLATRELELAVPRREAELARREQQLAAREALIAAAGGQPAPPSPVKKPGVSPLDFARQVLRRKAP